ncbi:hypothetical protein ACFLUE_01660 [Chloroflexota bacterium]
MKRPVAILLILFGLNEILAGLRHMPIPALSVLTTGFDWAHAITASLFAVLFVIHAWFHRRVIIGYFRNLRYWWIPVGLGTALLLWSGIIRPVLIIMGKL